MYDILQLNDMLVPELLDIAEQLKIPNAKKLDKQTLVYKILGSVISSYLIAPSAEVRIAMLPDRSTGIPDSK